MKNDIEAGIEYQSKFRFYFVALVFTLLAAAVQSAPLAEMRNFSATCEVLAWFCFLVSGVSALSFLEKSPLIYQHRDALKRYDFSNKDRSEIEGQLKSIEDSGTVKYSLAKYGFLAGLLLEVASRASHGLHS